MTRGRSRGSSLGSASINLALGLVALLCLAFVASIVYGSRDTVVKGERVLERTITPPTIPVRVRVENGCGVRGAAQAAASVLRAHEGIDVVAIGNAGGVELGRSVVLDRHGRPAAARRVAQALGIDAVVLQRRPGDDAELIVVVGYDGGRWDAGLFGDELDGGT